MPLDGLCRYKQQLFTYINHFNTVAYILSQEIKILLLGKIK